MLFTPSGLSEWFADDVDIHDDIYTFKWDDEEEKARLLAKKNGDKIRWQKLTESDETYFQFGLEIDPLTKSVVLKVTDFEEDKELEESKALWESQIGELKRIIGA
jgi:phage terminase small subunit